MYDYIVYHGKITRVRNENKYVWFDLYQNEEYKNKDGITVSNPSFFSARIPLDDFYKHDLKIYNEIEVKGIPKGYIDKNGLRQNYIQVLEITKNNYKSILNEKISFDTDGVMLWDGKRCEAIPLSPEEKKEIDELMKDYR